MAWQLLIQKLRLFRQARPKFPYENSEWPEADAIRTLTGQCFPKHSPAKRGIQVMRVFPRAALGLPIVLHYKDGPDKTGKQSRNAASTEQDPADHSILGEEAGGKKYERFASPVILRPIACADGSIAALAFVLSGPESVPVPLMVRRDADKTIVANGLRQTPTQSEAAKIVPLRRQNEHESPRPSAVDAFLNYVKDERPKVPLATPSYNPYRK